MAAVAAQLKALQQKLEADATDFRDVQKGALRVRKACLRG